MRRTYAEKLRDPRWQKVRLQIFERDGWICRICGADKRTLVVHHLAYCGEPWDAPPDRLVTLCQQCHNHFHEAIKVLSEPVRTLAWPRPLAAYFLRLRDARLRCEDRDKRNRLIMHEVGVKRLVFDRVISTNEGDLSKGDGR